jgi:8-amino-7-oxononanoate synthase
MKVHTDHALHNLLENRMDNRTFRFYAEHAKSVPNSYCQLQSINGREVVIGGKRLINFNAINYLGLESHPEMIESAQQAIAKWGTLAGSARAAAELNLFQTLERRLADWLGVEDVMVYTTVTLANHGIIPLLMRTGSLLLTDQEVHNSVQRSAIEAKGAGATLRSFRHDNFEQLEKLLIEQRRLHDHCMIALDGVYSMQGTYLNLPAYEAIAKQYNCSLYIDDAHGFGVIGPKGRGIVAHHGSDYENKIYVASLEKGLASLGGFAVIPPGSRDYFKYNSYTYTFAGQLPPPYLASSLTALDILEREGDLRVQRLNSVIGRVKREVTQMGFEIVGEDHPFPLVMVKIGGMTDIPRVSQYFFDKGIHILAVGFPVVPLSHGAMVRISLSAIHTDQQVDQLMDAFRGLSSHMVSSQAA